MGENPKVEPYPGGRRAQIWRSTRFHLRRAFSWNLQATRVEANEVRYLNSIGISEPTLQRYLTWRRSVLLVLCLPVLVLALLDTLDNFGDEDIQYNGWGTVWITLETLAAYAMPVSALAALWTWGRLERSARVIRWGWFIAFLVPLLLLIVPFVWLVRLDQIDAAEKQIAQHFTSVFVGLTFFSILVVVLPAMILSVSFGMQRGCLRLKTLLPESSLPGLFLAASGIVLPVFVLPIFVLLFQIAGSPLLLGGMVLLTVAPMLYLLKARTMMRPAMTDDGLRYLRRLQLAAKTTFWLGLGLLIAYAMVKTIPVPNLLLDRGDRGFQEMTLLGFSEATSLFRPWNWTILRWFVIEPFGRSLLTMVVVSDLLLRLNAYLWIAQRRVTASAGAEAYDQLMNRVAGKTMSAHSQCYLDELPEPLTNRWFQLNNTRTPVANVAGSPSAGAFSTQPFKFCT